MGSLVLSLETLLNFQTMAGINTSNDTLNDSNLPAFLYKCDTMNLLKEVPLFAILTRNIS